jgi:DNA topoisomerase-1
MLTQLVDLPDAPVVGPDPGFLVARLLEAHPPAAPLLRLPAPLKLDTPSAAASVGLTYSTWEAPGITRRRAGKGFSYSGPDGAGVDRQTLVRIKALAVPPAWRDVWICADPNGHIQAVGLDEKGRRQYRYHARFREIRDRAKFRHLVAFAESLPRIRARVAEDMAQTAWPRRQVLATVVHLLETTMIRVGNRAYARANQSFGLTTLEPRHVEIQGTRLRFNFRGKSGKEWRLDIRDRRIVRILKTCQELPGQSLFRYVNELDEPQTVTSADVNDYLRQVSGADITAKDFRTWNGTVLAAVSLAKLGPPERAAVAKRSLNAAIREVAARLGNTPAICRQCYVHPAVLEAYSEGSLQLDFGLAPPCDGLSGEEQAVLCFLRSRDARSGA